MKGIAIFAASAFVLLSLTGCASSPEEDLVNLPPPKDSHEAAQRILQIAAGYCKGMAEKHGSDFAVCFKQQTDIAIAQIEAQDKHLTATPPNSFEYTKDEQAISCQEYWKAVGESYATSHPGAKVTGLDRQCASVN